MKRRTYIRYTQITKIAVFLLTAIFIYGCMSESSDVVHYSFKHVKVSRYDRNKKTYLYYGKTADETKIMDEASVVLDWQSDGFLIAGIIFHEDKTVEILRAGVGEFKLIKRNSKLFFKEYESPQHNKIMQKFLPPNRFHNFYRLVDNLSFEAEDNLKFGSGVLIKRYPR